MWQGLLPLPQLEALGPAGNRSQGGQGARRGHRKHTSAPPADGPWPPAPKQGTLSRIPWCLVATGAHLWVPGELVGRMGGTPDRPGPLLTEDLASSGASLGLGQNPRGGESGLGRWTAGPSPSPGHLARRPLQPHDSGLSGALGPYLIL